jgi:hypothetical protein
VKLKTKVSFLFNKPDTLGDILGFLNVGSPYSIIDYSTTISNMDPYIIDNNINVVGNELTYSNNFINLSGKYNYVSMYLNNLEYIYFNNSLNPAFAKILLNGNPGDILNFPAAGPTGCCGFYQLSFTMVNAFKVDPATGVPFINADGSLGA